MRYYLVSWDCLGVECLQDITDDHPDNVARAHLFNAIKNCEPIPKSELGHQIAMMRLRAQMNPGRNYEIYLFTAEDDIDTDGIEAWIEADVQGFVDWVRVNYAKCLCDDRATRKPVIV
jgi:hypothetical protein